MRLKWGGEVHLEQWVQALGFDYAAVRAKVSGAPNPDGLTFEELVGLRLWSSSRGGYRDINHSIDHPPMWPAVALIDSALSKIPVRQDFVYRGVLSPGPLSDMVVEYRRGTTHIWRRFSSASMDENRAFAGNVLFVISSQSGRHIAPYSEFPAEMEVLFPRNSMFRVTDRIYTDTRLVAVLEELNG